MARKGLYDMRTFFPQTAKKMSEQFMADIWGETKSTILETQNLAI